MSDSHKPSRRVPTFTPVVLRFRKDGWTPGRQADFLGRLAETRCVSAAARHVGMTRESAYRLRDKTGAASFAAAWDAILGASRASRKATPALLWHRAFYGSLKPVLRGGKHVATLASSDNDALLSLYRSTLRQQRAERSKGGRSR